MSAAKTIDNISVSAPHSAKDKAFWYAVWTLDAASYAVVALLVYFVAAHLGRGAVSSGIALGIGAMSFGLTRYGLWRLTRPYAISSDAVRPAIDRAELCNFDFKLVFIALALFPSTEFGFLSDYTIVYGALAAVVILAWSGLMEPLKAANARDAARNAAAAGQGGF